MSLIMRLPELLRESRMQYEVWKQRAADCFRKTEQVQRGAAPEDGLSRNLLLCGDNAAFMRWLEETQHAAGKIKLIYVDPPFFTRTNYGAEIRLRSEAGNKIPVVKQQAYHDTWENGMEEYLKMLAVRFYLMKDLLADDGCLWVHLDWHAVHYVKVLLDEIFGEEHFINEIIWQYKSGGVSKHSFAKKHDTLLYYAKTKNYYFSPQKEKSYNRDLKPYRFKGVKEYKDEIGWYTMVQRKDVWQIDMVGRTSSERTGYVTQKPEALIERILDCCTREGDLCADFFGGSGTLAAAAERMHRRWISCDVGMLATVNTYCRLVKQGASFDVYEAEPAASETPTLRISAEVQTVPCSGRKLLRVTLLEYDGGSFEGLPVDEKYLPLLRQAAKEDSLQLLACWSVDPQYDGTYRPQAWFCREKGTVISEYEALGERFERIAVRAADLFGRSIFLELYPES